MPDPGRRIAALAVLLALAAPATVLGQGSGDDQYEDPFGDEPVQEEPVATPEPAPDPAPAPAPAQAPAPVAEGGSAPAPAPAPGVISGELPRTGAPVGLWLAGGALLLAAGLALRRRGAR